MGIRNYKPTSPARRYHSVLTFDDITKSTPHKPLTPPAPLRARRSPGS